MVAHEYPDIRRNSIRKFGGEGRPLLDYVYEKVKDVVLKGKT